MLTAALTVLRNPVYFVFLIMVGVGAYVTYTLNLWGPMLRMANAASQQGLEVGKEKLREFLEASDTGRQAMAMSGRADDGQAIGLQALDGQGRRAKARAADADDDDDDI